MWGESHGSIENRRIDEKGGMKNETRTLALRGTAAMATAAIMSGGSVEQHLS